MNFAMASTNKLFIFSLLLFLFPTFVFGQSQSDKIVVGEVGGEDITYAELKKNYSSGNIDEVSLEELKSFLPIFLDYKAKLKAAKDQGYYKDSTLIAEHTNYVKQAAYAWWLEKEIKPAAFTTFKERSSVELKPFHILVAVDKNATEEQIQEAIDKLENARSEIEDGIPLNEVDEKYSTKRGGRSMGGDIPWISAGRTVKPFEDVLYSLDVGEISEPFRTQFGYHIALLQDKRERTPARLTSHIYVRGTGDSAAYDKIYNAYEELEGGSDWSTVARNYSEDGASLRNNGRIGWVSYQGNYAMNFVDAVMRQDPDLEYSKPAKTNYGYHIFKIDSVESYVSEAQRDEALMQRLSDTPYFEENNQFVLDYLNEKYGSINDQSALNTYAEWLIQKDSVTMADISFSKELPEQSILSFADNDYSLQDFHDYLQDKFSRRLAVDYTPEWVDSYRRYVADKNIINLTLDRYPAFEEQSENYLNGLIVYNINETNIWSSATVDTSRLKMMYKQNLENYQYPERPFYYLISARQDSTIQNAINFVENGGSPDSLRTNIKNLSVSSDSTSDFSEPPFDKLQEMEEQSFSNPFEYNNRIAVFWLEDRLPARAMTFDEAFNRLLSEFQPEREEEWIEELRKTYNVKVNSKNLERAYNQESR